MFNEHMGNARGTFINRNHFAGFIEMTWPLILGLTMAMTDRGHSLKRALASDMLNRQALMALGIVVLLLSLLLSRSRAGIHWGPCRPYDVLVHGATEYKAHCLAHPVAAGCNRRSSVHLLCDDRC
jgi:hypothetical protein